MRLQLNAVVALASDLGLRRSEIFTATVDAIHHDNARAIVERSGLPAREVPFTRTARRAVSEWIEYRALLDVPHDALWVQLWSAKHVGEPMKRDAFEKLLTTYIAPEASYKRLRDTCAVDWIRAGLELEHTRRLLGVNSIEAMLPYAVLVTGTTEVAAERVEYAFAGSTAPAS